VLEAELSVGVPETSGPVRSFVRILSQKWELSQEDKKVSGLGGG
jgi:hypothetical protein